jgi:hypothetical protein
MTTLLTWNGIPPQIIGSFTEQERQAVIAYAPEDANDQFRWAAKSQFGWRGVDIAPLQPFVSAVNDVAIHFMRWGAKPFSRNNKIGFYVKQLDEGETTFLADHYLHEDSRYAATRLEKEDWLCIRLLAVSSIPADFIDLTGYEDRGALLKKYRMGSTRGFDTQLLNLAQNEENVVTPNPWDIIVFDAATPHLPKGANEAHKRILFDTWIEMRLPANWRSRVKSGDVPQLALTTSPPHP